MLARQHLLARADQPIERVITEVGGLQTQYAPSGYIGLWTRVAGFRRAALTEALEARTVVQASLMRVTIHMVARDEFWPYVAGIRRARQAWAARVNALPDAATLEARSDALRAALADGPRTVKELGELAAGFVGTLGLWVDLVRVPPSGTWERRRADRLGLADTWIGPDEATEAEGLAHLVRAYLRAFGPAPLRDISTWSGVPAADLRRAAAGLELTGFRDESGGALVDLPDGLRPDADTPAPVRFVPHWDAILLVHARRTGLLPEAFRPRVFTPRNPFSVGGVLVDGHVAAAWSMREGRIEVEPYRELNRRERDDVEAERAALEAFCA